MTASVAFRSRRGVGAIHWALIAVLSGGTSCTLTSTLDDLEQQDAPREAKPWSVARDAGPECAPGTCSGCFDCEAWCACAAPTNSYDQCLEQTCGIAPDGGLQAPIGAVPIDAEPSDCSQCVTLACGSKLAACVAEPSCPPLSECLAGCASSACDAACFAAATAGAALALDALSHCVDFNCGANCSLAE